MMEKNTVSGGDAGSDTSTMLLVHQLETRLKATEHSLCETERSLKAVTKKIDMAFACPNRRPKRSGNEVCLLQRATRDRSAFIGMPLGEIHNNHGSIHSYTTRTRFFFATCINILYT